MRRKVFVRAAAWSAVLGLAVLACACGGAGNDGAFGVVDGDGAAAPHLDEGGDVVAAGDDVDDGAWTPVCREGPGAGPAEADRSWTDARFPLEPILSIYEETQCRTISPSFLYDLVDDLIGYVGAGAAEIEAPPGAFGAAAVELTGFSENLLRAAVGIDIDGDLDAVMAEALRLYLARGDGPEGEEAWEEYSLQRPLLVYWEGNLGQLVLGLYLGWGGEALASALGIDVATLEDALPSLQDGLYQDVLGVDRETALAMMADAGLDRDDTLGDFASIVHVGPVVDGMRSAYVFVADRDVAPIPNLHGADFDVVEAGIAVPAGQLEVRTLKSLEDEELEGAEFAIFFVLDYSGSMSDADKGFLEEGLHHFLDVLPHVFRAGVIKFSGDASVVQTMTNDLAALHRAIDAPFRAGSTALYDAMGRGLSLLSRETAPLRFQIVFTDGMENASERDCHDSVVARSQDLGAPVFVVGMGEIDVPSMFTLTNATNACFLYAPSSDSIRAIYELAAHFIGGTYVLRWPATSDAVAPAVTIVARTPGGSFEDDFRPAP